MFGLFLHRLCDTMRPKMLFNEGKCDLLSEDLRRVWETYTGTLIEMRDATTLRALPLQTIENLDVCIPLIQGLKKISKLKDYHSSYIHKMSDNFMMAISCIEYIIRSIRVCA